MNTKEFKERMGNRPLVCSDADSAFLRSHMSPKKWAERVLRRAKVQLAEVIKKGYDTVWYEVDYPDGKFRRELGWVAWVLRDGSFRRSPAELERELKKVKDPYSRLLKFLG